MKKTFWITKYALTKGLFQQECEVVVSSPEVTYAKAKSLFCRIGRDAFESKEEALANAIKRAKAKRIALSKQSSKLVDLIAVWSDGPEFASKHDSSECPSGVIGCPMCK